MVSNPNWAHPIFRQAIFVGGCPVDCFSLKQGGMNCTPWPFGLEQMAPVKSHVFVDDFNTKNENKAGRGSEVDRLRT